MTQIKEYNKQYYLENKDKIKKHYLENKDKIKQYQLENKDKIKQYYKQYYKQYQLENKDKIKRYMKQYMKQYNISNEEKIGKYKKMYRLEHLGCYKKYNDNYKLIKRYGITSERKEQMILTQNNCCAICGNPFKNSRDVHVDHNHITKANREILCSCCNLAIGLCDDDIGIIQNIINYLNANYVGDNFPNSGRMGKRLKKIIKEQIIQEQNNKCFICPNEFKNSMDCQIDHNHKTGKVRKLLCKKCNLALGKFKENIVVMQRAIDYLEKHSDKYVLVKTA